MGLVQRVVPLMQAAGNHQWGDDYPNPEVFARDIQHDQLWVAELEEALAGVAAITATQEHEYREATWDLSKPALTVHRLAVDPVQRGKGVAVALMQHAESLARARDITILRANTDTVNEAAQQLFPKLGYRFFGDFTLSFRPGQRFLCYEKHLPIL